ncbi:TPA: cold-shock protein [Enterobacter hormaechei subsp. steigerwaltii]|uniref:cold shock small protein YmcF n=1 Tax=Enterobacter hormaechei TaxID=158836 RepID=UPI0027F954BD|nr:cold-shock protein [Enterobacter hormaechei]MED5783415.1 cold-shock protein [Enterobacter hormaechei]HDT4164255.1 cold-shock protein [Enterobacter hormaechei subsp. steigerwaltii]
MTSYIHFRCPCCHGSQYRTSAFDVSDKNPFGAKCIFCKSSMITLDHLAAARSVQNHISEYRK